MPAYARIRLGIAAALLSSFSATAAAQPTGAIEGSVVDANGSPLPGVVVTVTGPGGREESVTGADGLYAAAGLAAGDYLVTAILPGFETVEFPVSVGAGATRAVPIVLQVERRLETVSVVAEEPRIFARNVVAEPMMLQQSNITSVTSVVDNLPGVSIQEGDAYGFDDWSSNVAVRGFQVTISEAQIGTTIDGFPNGTSDYFSGAKANRFIDPMNLGGVEVSQGTADIASRSVEALGGTFNYLTDDPAAERTYTASTTIGENEGQRFSMRIDTGPLFGRETRAWIAAVRQEATDWVQGSARNEREHVAGKLVSSHGRVDLTGYLSYDSIHEDTFQRLYSEADFRADPRWDRLVGDWPGVPYLNQFYRPGWQTRRNNTFGYLKADWSFSDVTLAEPGRLFPSQPGPWRLAASLHRRRRRRRRRTGVGAGGARAGAGRQPARADPLREPGWGGRGTDARMHVVLHLQLLRLRRAGGRPRVPPRRHGRAVVPPQPLRQGPRRRNARRGVVRHPRRGRQHAARRHLV